MGEGYLSILRELDFIFHMLKLDINRAKKLYRFFRDLSECLEIRCPNLPVPLHEVIHKALGGDAV